MRAMLPLLLLTYATTAFAQSDLQIVATATPQIGLAVGDEFVVSTTLRNLGPAPALGKVEGEFTMETLEGFWFEIIGSETPTCALDVLEPDPPPQVVIFWSFPSLAVGEERPCAVRLRVRFIPSGNRTRLLFATSSSFVDDPVASNNTAALTFLFGSAPEQRPTIFTLSPATLGLLALGLLASSRQLARKKTVTFGD